MEIMVDRKEALGDFFKERAFHSHEVSTDPQELLNRIKEYCEDRIKPEGMPLNGRDWIAGYTYVLSRILGAINSGSFYHECSAKERREDHLRFRRKQVKFAHDTLNSLKKKVEEAKKEIIKQEEELKKVESEKIE
jgi:hypothetical protein